MSNLQRRKGHNFEREIARQLREIFPKARRGLQYQDGIQCADVEGTPFHIECKRGRKPNPRAAMVQALGDAKPGRIPVVVVKDDHKPPFVCMAWEDFIDLVTEWVERGQA